MTIQVLGFCEKNLEIYHNKQIIKCAVNIKINPEAINTTVIECKKYI